MSQFKMMRDALVSVLPGPESVHAGLWLYRGCKRIPDRETDSEAFNAYRDELVSTICQQSPSRLYQLAFERWQRCTASQQFRSLYAQTLPRLFLGTGNSNALEASVQTSHSYGMPMIPGSAIKGCARAYAAKIDVGKDYLDALFGEQTGAACVIWHDAWLQFKDGKNPFVREILTPHHQEYYGKRDEDENVVEATDFDSPVPVLQIAVQGVFYIVLEGDPAWTNLGLQILKKALEEVGIGAKRAAGYGLMRITGDENPEIERLRQQQIEEQKKAKADAEAARLATLVPWEQTREQVLKGRPQGQKDFVALLKALEAGRWQAPEEKRAIAEDIAKRLKANGQWKETATKKNPAKDEPYQLTLKVKAYLQ